MGHCGTQIGIMQAALDKWMREMEGGNSGACVEMQILSDISLVMDNG